MRLCEDDDRTRRSQPSHQHRDYPSLGLGRRPTEGGPQAPAALLRGAEEHNRVPQVAENQQITYSLYLYFTVG